MDNSTTFQGGGEVAYIPVVVNGKQARQTNADRIRDMSDDELAEWFQTVCTASSECSCSDCKFYALECTFEDWLRQEGV